MAELAGICLAVFQVLGPLFKESIDVIQSTSTFGTDAESTRLRISVAKRHTQSFERILFDKSKNLNFDGSLFLRLPSDMQQEVYDLLQRLRQMLHAYLVIAKSYSRDSPMNMFQTSPIELPSNETAELVHPEDRATYMQESTPFMQRLKWGIRDKRRAARIANSIEEWVNRTRLLLNEVIQPMTNDELDSLSKDDDTQTLKLSDSIRLRRLLLLDKPCVSNLRIPIDDLELITAHTSVQLGKIKGRIVAIERKYYDTNKYGYPDELEINRIQQLAALLCSHKDPNFRVLQGLGYINDIQNHSLMIVFAIPDLVEARPVSLFELISRKPSYLRPQLGDRFKLAHALAESIFLLHSVGWIHKGVRSHNVIFFPNMANKIAQGSACLLSQSGVAQDSVDSELVVREWEPKLMGFEASRLETADTLLDDQSEIEFNMYRHPERWGKPSRHNVLHDLYSLGAVLLEIGLWQQLQTLLKPSKLSEVVSEPRSMQELLVSHASKRLGYTMGSRYRDVVLGCLAGKLRIGDVEGIPGKDESSNTDKLCTFRADVLHILSEASMSV